MSAAERSAAEPEDATITPVWARVVVFGSAALVCVLAGIAAGLFLARSESAGPPGAEPGPADIGFAQDMSVHHLQAVKMGNLARDKAAGEDVRRMAFDIAMTQQGQVGRMHGWLALWGEPDQAIGSVMEWMQDHAHHGTEMPENAAMPGMATREELRKLERLDGTEFDVYFLQLMIRHHQGGTPMAEEAAANARVPAVRALAQSMVDSQGAEVVTMTDMLAARGAEPLPFG